MAKIKKIQILWQIINHTSGKRNHKLNRDTLSSHVTKDQVININDSSPFLFYPADKRQLLQMKLVSGDPHSCTSEISESLGLAAAISNSSRSDMLFLFCAASCLGLSSDASRIGLSAGGCCCCATIA
jgi:hypothetical protein